MLYETLNTIFKIKQLNAKERKKIKTQFKINTRYYCEININ